MTTPRLLVTLEGYAVEGGYDVAGGPMTCYSPTIALGWHRGPGDADGLWGAYERAVDEVVALGADGVRLTTEWARIEPHPEEVDEAALDRYAAVARYARERDLDVTIALVDAAWPAWLGLEPWILPWTVPYVEAHGRRTVEYLADVITGVVGFTDPSGLVVGGFVRGSCPPWRRGEADEARFASGQIESLLRRWRDDELIGPLWRDAVDVRWPATAAELTAARASEVDEVHLRSLLAGHGPTAVGRGLARVADGSFERRDDLPLLG